MSMNNQQLFEACPSAFTKKPHSSRTDRYHHISTIDVVKELAKHDFLPYSARQNGLEHGNRYAKHVIRFRNEKIAKQNTKGIPEALLFNAHDGTCRYRLRFGVYVLVCSNGLIVPDGPETCVVIKHVGDVLPKVVEGTKFVLAHATQTVKTIDSWSKVMLLPDEKITFAKAARQLRFGDKNGKVDTAITPEQLIEPRRIADRSNDLWHTFNVIQENVIRGGVVPTTGRASREITNITRDLKLNQALWSLGQKVYEIKSGGRHVKTLHA